eukprot:TCONS_00067002-protein
MRERGFKDSEILKRWNAHFQTIVSLSHQLQTFKIKIARCTKIKGSSLGYTGVYGKKVFLLEILSNYLKWKLLFYIFIILLFIYIFIYLFTDFFKIIYNYNLSKYLIHTAFRLPFVKIVLAFF